MITHTRTKDSHRGTITVYRNTSTNEYYWEASSRNGKVLADGGGHDTEQAALKSVDALFGIKYLPHVAAANSPGVKPWRLIVHWGDRNSSRKWSGEVR